MRFLLGFCSLTHFTTAVSVRWSTWSTCFHCGMSMSCMYMYMSVIVCVHDRLDGCTGCILLNQMSHTNFTNSLYSLTCTSLTLLSYPTCK
jgi:hypothetical protein